jgi:hypothetical protein
MIPHILPRLSILRTYEQLEYLLHFGTASWESLHLKGIVLGSKLEDRTWFLRPEDWDDWSYQYEKEYDAE